jgi:hypothetical protein
MKCDADGISWFEFNKPRSAIRARADSEIPRDDARALNRSFSLAVSLTVTARSLE